MRSAIVLLCVILTSGGVLSQETSGALERLAGTWIDGEGPTVGLECREYIVTIARPASRWEFTFTWLVRKCYTDEPPTQKNVRGHFPVREEKGTLIVDEGDAEIRYTYRLEGDELVMPALLRVDPTTWVISGPQPPTLGPEIVVQRHPDLPEPRIEPMTATFACEHDPFEVPRGRAEFFVWSDSREPMEKHYVFGKEEDVPEGRAPKRELRFYATFQEGRDTLQYTIVFDRRGQPWIKRRSQYEKYGARQYTRIDER